MSESQGHEYLRSHQISGEMMLVDVDSEGATLLEEAARESNRHAARTLVKEGPLRLVLLALKEGAALHEHEATGPLSIHVLKGSVKVAGAGREEAVGQGRALVFASSVAHSVHALSDALLLVTIAQLP